MSSIGHNHDVQFLWDIFPFNYQAVGGLLWVALGNDKDTPKYGDWWNYI